MMVLIAVVKIRMISRVDEGVDEGVDVGISNK